MSDYRAQTPRSATVLLDVVTARAREMAATRSLQVASVLFITALTAAASQFSVTLPFTPVPLTLQPMIVLLGACALGARRGAAAQVLYLMAGIAGLQVFAFSPVLPQGIGRLFGPTGGYLMAYPLAAFVAGTLAERGFDRRYLTSVVAMAAGLAVIFAGGVLWLGVGMPGAVGIEAALAAGLYPFVLVDVFKVLAAAALLPAVWSFVGAGTNTRKY